MSQDTTPEERKPNEAGLLPWDALTELHVIGAKAPRYELLPPLVVAWLRELLRIVPATYGRKVAGAISYPPDYERADLLKTVRTEHGQVLTLRFNAFQDRPRPGDGGEEPTDPRWFRRVEVRGHAQRTDNAALAALSVLEGSGVGEDGVNRIRGHLARRENDQAYTGNWSESDELSQEEERLLAYARALLRHHRPNLDLASSEGSKILIGVCERAAEVADATARLSSYLEFGADGRATRPDVEDAQMAVYAAELHHVVGMTHREIAAKLHLPRPEKEERNSENRNAANRIKRGTSLLVQALGEDGWQRYKRRMRYEYEQSDGIAPPSQ